MEKLSSTAAQVLFVCTGNTCRSPMAEYLFHLRAGSDTPWRASSAGVAARDGDPASPEAVQALAEVGADLSLHRSRSLTQEQVDRSAWVVVMTRAHREEVLRRFPAVAAKVRLLTEFGAAERNPDVFDPVGGGLAVYRRVRERIESALADLILFLREQRGVAGAGSPPKGKQV